MFCLRDVGLAKQLIATVTQPGGWTPAYAAPEVLMRRGANEKSDIYSFGLMIWQVYTTRQPTLCDECNVESGWPIKGLLNGSIAGHRGALAIEKNHRPTAVQLKEELELFM